MKFGCWIKTKPSDKVPSIEEPLIVTDGKGVAIIYKYMGYPFCAGTRIRRDLATHYMRLKDIPLPDPCGHPTFDGCCNEIDTLKAKIKSLESQLNAIEKDNNTLEQHRSYWFDRYLEMVKHCKKM